MLRLGRILATLLSASVLTACLHHPYVAKPIDIEKTTEKLSNRDPSDQQFLAYLTQHGYQASSLPLNSWGLDELTYCAIYFHPKLSIAKAQLAHQQALIDAANIKSSPTINGHLGHSDLRNGDANPWAYGISFDIPIEMSGKRVLATEQAFKEAEIARIEVANTAWLLRSQIDTDLINYQQNVAMTELLKEQLDVRGEIVNMLQKRLEKGIASSTELSREQLNLMQSRSDYEHSLSKEKESLLQIIIDAGLNPEKSKDLSIKVSDTDKVLQKQASVLEDSFISKQLQTSALLNRLDMRRAVTQYEIAEIGVRQEIAKQYPDFSLSPGLAFEFGDTVWSLGISSLLLFAQQHDTQILAAERLRDVEGVKVYALQADIINQLHQSYQQYVIAKSILDQAKAQLSSQQELVGKQQKQFVSGLIDRLTLKQAQLAFINAKQQHITAQFETLSATHKLENVMQAPIFSQFVMPENYSTP